MSSEQSGAATGASRAQSALAKQAYGVAIPAMKDQYSLLNAAMAQGGEPEFMRAAFDQQRTGVSEGMIDQQQGQARGVASQMGGAAQGGNLMAALSPAMGGGGAQIAQQLYGSRVNEAMGQIEQMNKLRGMAMGQSVQAGSGSIAAGGAQLQGISGMPAYNQTLALALGAANLGMTGYGAYANRPPGQQPPGQPGPYNDFYRTQANLGLG